MKLRKIMNFILAFLMVLTIMPQFVQHTEAVTILNRVTLMGVTVPKDGQKPTIEGIYVPGTGVGYKIGGSSTSNIRWYNETDGEDMSADDVFEHNKRYELIVYFDYDEGYGFDLDNTICQLPDIKRDYYSCTVFPYGVGKQDKVCAYIMFNTNRDKYTISFDGNGGFMDMEDEIAYHNDWYVLPDCGFMAPGPHLIFDTWDKGKPGAKIRITSDTVIKANWKVADGYTRVKNVEIIAGKMPVIGEYPSVTGWRSADEDKYSVITDLTSWTNVSDGKSVEKDERFMAGKQYRITTIVNASDKYFFESSPVPTVTIKGLDGSVYKVDATVQNYNQSVFVTFTFNPLSGYDLLRVYGENRFGTSMALSDYFGKQRVKPTINNVILACSDNFADALAGSYLSALKGIPILIINDSKAAIVEDYLKNNMNPGGTVFILGGEKAVSAKIENDLSKLGFTPKRLAGSNRYGTNLAILEEAGISGNDILVATGTNFADSLSASATGLPILLVGKELNDDQKAFLNNHKSVQFTILGGTGAVSQGIEDELNKYGAVTRISGANRYQTSQFIAQNFYNEAGMVILANGDKFPDGLCAGPVGYLHKAPLLLIKDGQTQYATDYAKDRGIKRGIAAGGTAVISNSTFRGIFKLDDTAVINEIKK